MQKQISSSIRFLAFFTASKAGKPGLTGVTVDVYKNGVVIITGAAATESAGGLYSYLLASGSVDTAGNYVAIFKTTDTTVDLQHVPSYWNVGESWVQNVDAAVTSRSSHSAADVWSVTTRALSASGVQAIWDFLVTNITIVGSIGKRITDNLDINVNSRLATTGYTAPDNSGIATLLARLSAARAGYLDALNGFSIASIWAAVVDSPGVSTLLNRIPSLLTITGGKVDVNDKGGFSLTVADKEDIAVRVESHLLDEGDSQMLINAIVGAIGNTNVNVGALVAAIRSDIERSGGTLALMFADYARRSGDYATAGNIAAVGTQIGALNNLSQAQVTAALTAYAPLTTTQATANKAEIVAALPTAPDNAGISDIKTKVLALNNAPTATENANAVRGQLSDEVLAEAAGQGVLATPSFKIATNSNGSVNATGGGGSGGGSSADEIWNHPKAQALIDDVETIVAPFEALDPTRPVIVVPAPAAPVEHQVPVLFAPTKQGLPEDATVKFAFTDKSPVLVATTNEVIEASSPFMDEDFTVFAGCFLYTSEYLVEQGASGIYFAESKECGYNQLNAKFRVPPLPEGRTFWYLAELLRMFRAQQ